MKAWATYALLGLLLSACGAEQSNSLRGAIESAGFNLDFDTVEIDSQQKGGQLVAMIVSYVKDPNDPQRRELPVKVVANAPIEQGQRKDVTGAGGQLIRVTHNQSQFPPVQQGHITFDELGAPGQTSSGTFFITFTTGSTLNGEFSATTKLLSGD